VFLVSTLLIAVMASRLHVKHRAFHLLTFLITGIAALSYYAMATKSGTTFVPVGWHKIQGIETPVFRQVFWARYVDWALTSPLLLLDLALLAGLSWIDVVSLLIADEAMLITGLFAAVHRGPKSGAKWGWYAFSCLFFIYIFFQLLWKGRKSAQHQHKETSGLYTKLSIYTIILWLFYPIIFALGEGVGRIHPNAETIAFAVLDIFAKSVFGIWLLFVHKHDSEDVHPARLPDSWTEPRGTRRGHIHLPGGDSA